MLDERPIINDTQSRSRWDSHVSLWIDAVKLIGVSTGINFRKWIFAFGPNQGQFIVVGVSDCGHTMAMSRSAGMHLNVETQGLGEMSYLHGPGDAEVIFRISPQNVGTAI